jgi:prevent-host-death family protein
MRVVNIAELKNRLSTYLTYAKAGEEVVIRDRNRPVAKLVPYVILVDATEEELALVAVGHLRLPEKRLNIDEFLKMPKPTLSGNAGTQAVLDEREEGW